MKMGKSTISMAMFNSFLYVYQAGYITYQHDIPMTLPWRCRTVPGDFLELSAEVGLSLAVPQLGPMIGAEAGRKMGKVPKVKMV